MENLYLLLAVVQAGVFAVLAFMAARLGRRRPSRQSQWLVASFALISTAGLVVQAVPPQADGFAPDLGRRAFYLLLFAIPWAVHRFAAAMGPTTAALERVLAAVTAVAVAPAFFADMPRPVDPQPAWATAVLVTLGVVWTTLSVDAVRALRLEAARQPRVAAARLRTIAVGIGVLVLALLGALMLPSGAAAGPRLGVTAISMASAGVFLCGFAPPPALRARWRRHEVRALREAARLLMSARTVESVYDVVLPTAARLVGGRSAAVLGDAGGVAAAWNGSPAGHRAPLPAATGDAEDAVATPVNGHWLVVELGPHAPLFGRGEADLLGELADLAGLALDRARGHDREAAARQALAERERQMAEAQKLGAFGSYTWFVDEDSATWSEHMFRLVGRPVQTGALPISEFLDFVHTDDLARMLEVTGQVAAGGDPVEMDYRIVRPDGEVRWLRHRGQMVDTEDGRRKMVGVIQDTTERRQAEARLAHQALHDALTGLPNRYLAIDRLDHAIGRARRDGRWPAVLFLDLDRFKVVNDGLGHRAGDELLRQVGARLREAVRPSDTVARLGGDEFVVVVEGGEPEDEVRALATRVSHALRLPFTVEGREVRAAASIGVAVADDASGGADGVLRDADAAMYRAKETGRGRVEVFTESLRRAAVDRLEIEADLRDAIARDQLELAFQPTVSVTTGAIVGLEALVRWRHPVRGPMAAQDLVAVAEESDLINELGRWVLASCAQTARRWLDHGEPVQVWCNISAHQFRRDDVAALVLDAASAAGVHPSLLGIELTETTLMSSAVGDVLAVLKAEGVGLAIDDFGTGFSSLSYLRQFPVDVLKVDRSFVAGLGRDPGDEAIVRACIALARSLGLDTVAEGVESTQQLAMLREMGCSQAQGYLFSPPVGAAAALELVERAVLGAAPPATRRVVVCDDDPAARMLLRMAFEAEGAEVTETASAEECVVAAASARPDLVVLDLVMPGHDGMWALRRLRARLPQVPVHVVTALDAPSSQAAALAAGAAGCHDKAEFVERVPGLARGAAA